MDSQLLLVKVITLLFKETRLGDSSNSSTVIANDIINGIRMPEPGADFDRSRETLVSLRATAKWLAESEESKQIDQTTLLQRIRVNVAADDWLYEAFRQGIEGEFSEDQIKNQCALLRRELNEYLCSSKATEIMKKATHKLMFQPDTIPSMRDFIRDVAAELEPFMMPEADDAKIEGELDSASSSDVNGIRDMMIKGHQQTSTEGILRFGYQALNRMLGEHGGGKRGESIVVGALPHQFKTGWVRNLFKHIALYNVPWMTDKTKKPTLLFITLEDEMPATMLWFYANLKANETGEESDLRAVHLMSPDEQMDFFVKASQYVIDAFSRTGYEVIFKRLDPSTTTFHTVFDYITKLQANGHELHACVVDYLAMMSKRGCTQGPAGTEIRDLFRRFRNFMAARNILFITPHQLSPAAKQLVRGNVEDLVKEVAGKGYYDGCTTIDQEVDVEMYIHKVKVHGDWYLTVQRGKHRGLIEQTPDQDMYFVMPFQPIGGIRDDINGADTSTRTAGSAKGSSGSWAF